MSDDLISRQEAIDALKQKWDGMVTSVFDVIKNLQPTCNQLATDCISRQAAIDALDQIFDRCEEIEAHLPEGDPDRTGYKMYQDYMTVWKYLHQLPSAQPEIIRCKDCEWFRKEYGWNCIEYTVCGISPMHHPIRKEDDYCSRAERRTDERSD